jgi:predicted nucleic acid-binding protein
VIARAVVDASVAIKWVVDERGSDLAARLTQAELLAPALLLAECSNALWRRVRLGLMRPAEAAERLAALQSAPVALRADDELTPAALEIALRLDHPIYDCLYLALAEDGVPLVTADRRLLEKSRGDPQLAALVRPLEALGG